MKKIFIVEDDKPLRELLVTYLADAGYDVTPFADGIHAKNAIDLKPDLWILDIMLPGLDGYSLIKEIKKNSSSIPVIFMSARSAELDRVVGLEMGSEDYLPKPFLPRELVLRVNRILGSDSSSNKRIVNISNSTFDISKRLIITDGKEIPLTVKEYDLLKYLIDSKGEAKSRNNLLDSIWGENYYGSDRVVDDTLRRLRKKIPNLPVENVYGFGYILTLEDSNE